MKHLSILFLTFVISFSIVFADELNEHVSDRNKEADEEYHKARKEWLNSMHKTEPGVDYKILNREFRLERMTRKNHLKSKISKDSPTLQKYESENGKVIGTWTERGSRNQSGRIHIADVDLIDSIIYAASAGGNVWKGTLSGKNWQCLNNSMQFDIRNIKVEYNGADKRIFVFDRKYVYFSDNDGFTWEKSTGLENIQGWGEIKRGVIIHANGRICYVLATEWDYQSSKAIESLYFSTDFGETFTKIFSVNQTDNIDIWGVERCRGEYGYPVAEGQVDTHLSELICVHQDTVFSIESNNKKVLNIFNEIKNGNPQSTRVSGNDIGGKLYVYINVLNSNSQKLEIYKTSDFFQTLNYQMESPTNYFMRNSFASSKTDSNLALIGGVEGFKLYFDINTSEKFNYWGDYYQDTKNKLHADIPGIKCFRTNDSDEFYLICTDGGIFKTNKDLSVENISLNDLNVSQYYSIYTTIIKGEQVVSAGSQDQGYQICKGTEDSVLNFSQIVSGDYGSLTSGDAGKSMWSVYPGFAQYYSDIINSQYNVTWNFPNSKDDRVWMPPIVAVPGNPEKAYVAAGGSKAKQCKLWTLTYTEVPKTITPVELSYQFDKNDTENDVSALAISSLDINYIYTSTKTGKFFTSTDAGVTWTETAEFIGPGSNYLHGTCIYPSKKDLGTVYLTGSGYSNPGVFVSTDNGITFTAIQGLPPALVYQIDMNPEEDVIFAATSIGPFIYIKNQNKWYDISGLDAPEQNYWSVNYLPEQKVARFATYGRGIWDFEIESLITGVNDVTVTTENNIKVYPNPAKNFININFEGKAGEKTLIKIVDLEGRLIYKCFDGVLESEENNLRIELSGVSDIKSGTYLILMVSEGMVKYQKFVVSK